MQRGCHTRPRRAGELLCPSPRFLRRCWPWRSPPHVFGCHAGCDPSPNSIESLVDRSITLRVNVASPPKTAPFTHAMNLPEGDQAGSEAAAFVSRLSGLPTGDKTYSPFY